MRLRQPADRRDQPPGRPSGPEGRYPAGGRGDSLGM